MNTLAEILAKIKTEQGPSAQDKFYLEFGKFVCAFADVESATHYLFKQITRMKDEKSRAIIGGTNLGALIAIIKRVTAVSSLSQKRKVEIAELLGHLDKVSKFRHDLIHRGATISETGITSGNIFTAKTYDAIEEVQFQLSHVVAARTDLRSIHYRLWLLFADPEDRRQQKPDARRKAFAFAPWRYTPVQPSNPLKQLRQKSQKQSPRL